MPAQLGRRESFPALGDRIYLNHAAVSPPSERVRQALSGLVSDYAALGMGAFFPWMEQRARLKGQLGELLGVPADKLAFGMSTNRMLCDLALSLRWAPGDRILCFEGEFPANVTPWQAAATAAGAQVDLMPLEGLFDGGFLEALEAELRAGVKLVAVSAVQFSTGVRMPLAEMTRLAHAHGALIAADVIQAAGVVPLDLGALGVDFAAGGAHKWLMGMEGVGYLYARDPGLLDQRIAGWLSHEDPVAFLMEGPGHLRYDRPLRSSLDRLEVGSTNGLGCAALEAGIAPLRELGIPAIHAHVQGLHDRLEEGLSALGLVSLRPLVGFRSGTLSLRCPGRPATELAQAFGEEGVSVTAPDGLLRISPHWPNDAEQCARVLEIAARIV